MTRARLALWLPLMFVPLAAWSKDATVVTLLLSAIPLAIAGARPALSWPMIACAAWTAASLLWAPDLAWDKWLLSWIALGAGALLFGGIAALPGEKLGSVPMAIISVVSALFVVLLIERVTGAALIGSQRPGDPVPRLFDILSAGLAFLCCLTYPAALLITRRTCTHAAAVFVAAIFGLALSYNMDAAPLALAIGACAFALTWRGGRTVFFSLMALLGIAALGWGFVAAAALDQGLARWLTDDVDINWGFRVEIWASVAALIAEHPWIGHGFEAGRVLGRPEATGSAVPVPFMHPHNGMLQVWLEFGLVGVALLTAWGATAARSLAARANDPLALATAAATIATAATFWLISFGLWAGWWLAALGLIAAALSLAVRSDVRAIMTQPSLKHQHAP